MARSARSKGLKDPAYLNWLRDLACLICDDMCERRVFVDGQPWQQTTPTEVAHVGDRGLSQKCPDQQAIPLCAWHHRIGPESHHVLGKKFWDHHGFDKSMVITTYNRWFEGRKAA